MLPSAFQYKDDAYVRSLLIRPAVTIRCWRCPRLSLPTRLPQLLDHVLRPCEHHEPRGSGQQVQRSHDHLVRPDHVHPAGDAGGGEELLSKRGGLQHHWVGLPTEHRDRRLLLLLGFFLLDG